MTKHIAVTEAEIEAVYEAIYAQLRADGTLPQRQELAERLGMTFKRIARCLVVLRWQGRIEPVTFLPTDYRQHWKEMPVIRDTADTVHRPLPKTGRLKRRSELLEQ